MTVDLIATPSVVIDGWGIPTEKSPKHGDAILAAETPVMDEFSRSGSKKTQGYTELEASSLAVGLPEGLMGNSEVGHLNIGAGRVVWQDVRLLHQDSVRQKARAFPDRHRRSSG